MFRVKKLVKIKWLSQVLILIKKQIWDTNLCFVNAHSLHIIYVCYYNYILFMCLMGIWVLKVTQFSVYYYNSLSISIG